MKLLELNIAQIVSLCRKYKVKALYVFGSILTSRFNDESDVDLAVSFDKENIALEDYADNFFSLQFDLEAIFNRQVDLVCYDAITNPIFRQELDETKRLLFGWIQELE